MSDAASSRCLTPPALAKRWGVSPDKVLAFIRRGELRAFNIALNLSGRPRYLIDAADVVAFEQRRSAGPVSKVTRRKRNEEVVQYF